ncbi:MAG: hypothetical protein VW226_10955, partial [Rhodospirillaceae bacterium]
NIWATAEKCEELTKRGSLRGLTAAMYPPEERVWGRDVAKFLRRVKPHLFQAPRETIDEERAVIADVASKEPKNLIRFECRAAGLGDKYLQALQDLSDQNIN